MGVTFGVLTVVDQYTRESPALEPAHSLTAAKVVDVLEEIAAQRGYPESITVDNGTSSVAESWMAGHYKRGVKLDFIRRQTVDNGYIESFNGRLCDECLNTICSGQSKMPEEKLEKWWWTICPSPHSALANLPPAAFAKALRERKLTTNQEPQTLGNST